MMRPKKEKRAGGIGRNRAEGTRLLFLSCGLSVSNHGLDGVLKSLSLVYRYWPTVMAITWHIKSITKDE